MEHFLKKKFFWLFWSIFWTYLQIFSKKIFFLKTHSNALKTVFKVFLTKKYFLKFFHQLLREGGVLPWFWPHILVDQAQVVLWKFHQNLPPVPSSRSKVDFKEKIFILKKVLILWTVTPTSETGFMYTLTWATIP